MLNTKPAPTDQPILEVIKNRWSPLGYNSEKPIEEATFHTLLEAARWAPSCYNEQPWQYVVGHKGDTTHAQLSDCLFEGNAWAKEAPILMLSIAKNYFDHNHNPNTYALHDLGAANALFNLQAISMDLAMHQMAGLDAEKARECFKIGKDHDLGSLIALGYPLEDTSELPEKWRTRNEAPRQRKALEKMLWVPFTTSA